MQHADGVYLDLPMRDYLADRALSGSAFKRLLTDPGGWRWERPDNPLWTEAESRPRLRGSAAHCAILEGIAEYEARYALEPQPPEGAIVTVEHVRDWLRPHKARAPKEVKLTGSRDELIDQARAIAEANGLEFELWEDARERLVAGRTPIAADDDTYVRLIERFIRRDPNLSPLVSNGFPELSIFWSEQGLRFKSRLDYLNATAILDLKTYGQPPRLGRSLRQHCVGEIVAGGYDIQAVHNTRAVEIAAERAAAGELELVGKSSAELDRCAELLKAIRRDPPPFHWLFVRMGGNPTSIAIPFRKSDGRWQHVETMIAIACDRFRQFAGHYGDDLWLVTEGVQEIEDRDWPLWAWEIAA